MSAATGPFLVDKVANSVVPLSHRPAAAGGTFRSQLAAFIRVCSEI